MRRFFAVALLLVGAGCAGLTPVAAPAPSAVPAPTSTPTRLVTPTAAPAVVAIPTAESGASDASPQPDAGRDSFRLDIIVSAEDGSFFGDEAEYRTEYPEGALTWRGLIEWDTAGPYSYWGIDVVAEPGDEGCSEFLFREDGQWSRNNFLGESTMTDFVLIDEPFDDFAGETDQAAPREAAQMWQRLGMSAPPGETGSDGTVVRQADLSSAGLMAARDVVFDLGGLWEEWQTGTFETRESSDGELLSYVFNAERTGERDELGDGRYRFPYDAMRSEVHISSLETPNRVTPTTTLAEAGGCQPFTTGLVRDWQLVAIVADSGAFSTYSLAGTAPTSAPTNLTIEVDGTLTGTTGCQSIDGLATISFTGLADVEIGLDGTPCSGDFAQLEASYIELLRSGPSVAIDLEGRLLMTASREETPGVDELSALIFTPAN